MIKKKNKFTNILIVDDDEFNIYSLNILLKRLKLKAHHTNNGLKAIDMVIKNQKNVNKKMHYKLILMDCNMPIMNGYTACQKLKKMITEGVLQNMHISACTADVTE